ncbi:MAG: helix-turn-helix transcriptional regulator [Hyphomicrobiaceae bacterium]
MQTNYALELKVARRLSGLSQYEIAHLLGVSRSRVSKLECGIARPTPDELTTLSLIYSTSFLTMRGAVMPTIHANLEERLHSLPNKDSYTQGTSPKADTLNTLTERLATKRKLYGA